MAARTATVRGREVRWRVEGAGEPLVLVHGLSGSGRWWEAVLPPLVARHACHLLDVPRFGAALHPDGVAGWLGDWADAAGLRRFLLAGHSLGGAAAARLAAARPELVEALVLVAAAGMPSGRRLAGYALPLAAALRTSSPAFLRRLTADALRTGPDALLRGALYAARADVREEARAIRAPTLLVWGDRDPLVPPALAQEWLRAIPHARLVTLAGAGHVPMVERPAELAAELLSFLDEPGDRVGR
ncbi:MAG TPA: alpha/beta fold hydrolase [Gaiellaceae bacterium]|jgi:pimeloyl-ACP methyl ester carboxylesterase|nr:alpha/beta fold hydrolase [Gaiellaceae bacterium]